MRRLLLATLLLLLLLVPAGAAVARDRPEDLLIDACRDEKVDGSYSQRTYRRALDQLPADSDQYTACRDVINRARLAALSTPNRDRGSNDTTVDGSSSGSSGSGGSGTASASSGSTSNNSARSSAGRSGQGGDSERKEQTPPPGPTAAETRAVQNATRAGAEPVRIGGELLEPGAVRQVADSSRELPTPMIVLLAVLAVCALSAAGAAAWSRVHARRLG